MQSLIYNIKAECNNSAYIKYLNGGALHELKRTRFFETS